MALTYTVEQGAGVDKTYDIHWESKLGFLDRSHVFVYIGDNYTLNQIPFVWVNDNQIRCSAPVGTFTIRRIVPRNKAWNNYTDGAILREKNLDDSYAQSLMIQEEITDGYLTTNSDIYFVANIDLQGKRIINVADAIDPQDPITKGVQDATDAAQDLWNTQQDNRVTALEQNIPVDGARYVANFSYTAAGGETTITTGYTFSYAVLAINGAMQTIGKAFSASGSSFTFAEPLEEGDEVAAVLTVPFVPGAEFVGTGDWLYTALGGETSIDVGLAFTKILLTANGVVQIPTKAFDVLGTTLHFAEPLEEGDELYGMLSA